MAYSITIDGEERVTDILSESIKVEDAINDKQNTCQLTLVNLSGLGIPEIGEEIIITLADDTKLFAGYTTSIVLTKVDSGIVEAEITCIDYVWLLDRNLVHKTYQDQTDKEIIDDMVQSYCLSTGITTDYVIEYATIDQIAFNYLQLSEAMRKICDLTAMNWYIDYDKNLRYFPLSTNSAPFNL